MVVSLFVGEGPFSPSEFINDSVKNSLIAMTTMKKVEWRLLDSRKQIFHVDVLGRHAQAKQNAAAYKIC
mgnify:CR=1 FL=1